MPFKPCLKSRGERRQSSILRLGYYRQGLVGLVPGALQWHVAGTNYRSLVHTGLAIIRGCTRIEKIRSHGLLAPPSTLSRLHLSALYAKEGSQRCPPVQVQACRLGCLELGPQGS